MGFGKLAKQPANLSVAEMSSRRLAEEAVTSELLSRPERYVSNFAVGGSFGERQRETLPGIEAQTGLCNPGSSGYWEAS